MLYTPAPAAARQGKKKRGTISRGLMDHKSPRAKDRNMKDYTYLDGAYNAAGQPQATPGRADTAEIDSLKRRLREYVERITERSSKSKLYNCPLCGSGKAKKGIGFDIAENQVAFANEKAKELGLPCMFEAVNIYDEDCKSMPLSSPTKAFAIV